MNEINTLHLDVNQIMQTSGGGDHVVIFKADLNIRRDTQEIRCIGWSIDPRTEEWIAEDPERRSKGVQEEMNDAVAEINAAICEKFKSINLGCDFEIWDIVYHAVDFKPHRFRQYTSEYLENALGGTG